MQQQKKRKQALSEQEHRVAELLADDRTTKQIASKMRRGERWIRTLVIKIFKKLELKTRPGIAAWFERTHWVHDHNGRRVSRR